MHYISCLFERHNKCLRPLMALVYDDKSKKLELLNLYLKSIKTPLFEAEDNYLKIKALIEGDGDVALSNYKHYVEAFDLGRHDASNVYDTPTIIPKYVVDDIGSIKQALIINLKDIKSVEFSRWQNVLAQSQIVYRSLEKNGYWNTSKCYPIYDFTYTGRSKCLGDNIQGATENIYNSNGQHDTFVCFDWISADIRVASYYCKDETLNDSFKDSDPYTKLYEMIGDPNYTRDKCKLELFGCLYSLDYNNPILNYYPKLPRWMQDSLASIEKNKYSKSILGRKFHLNNERTTRSVFNAQFQGSVAHAMQSVLYKTYKKFPSNIMADIYDSLVLSCSNHFVSEIIEVVSQIMLKPFKDILDDELVFPLKVSVGKEWKQWEFVKEIR